MEVTFFDLHPPTMGLPLLKMQVQREGQYFFFLALLLLLCLYLRRDDGHNPANQWFKFNPCI